MVEIPIEPVINESLQQVMMIVQVIGGIAMLVGILISIWSLLLQKKEVIKQNNKIIDLLERILKK